MTSSPESRVRAGASLLDVRNPGWRDKITRPVNLLSAADCVLGQVYGNYWDGRDVLDLDSDAAVAYGFVGKDNNGSDDYYSDSRGLVVAWTALLAEPVRDTKSYYDEATLLALLDAGVTTKEFAAFQKVSKVLSSI
jgi:hypothetical protein